MARLPQVKARELTAALRKLGFAEIHQKGSHLFFKHPDGRVTSVPIHSGKDIGRGLLRAILRQVKVSPNEFQKLL